MEMFKYIYVIIARKVYIFFLKRLETVKHTFLIKNMQILFYKNKYKK